MNDQTSTWRGREGWERAEGSNWLIQPTFFLFSLPLPWKAAAVILQMLTQARLAEPGSAKYCRSLLWNRCWMPGKGLSLGTKAGNILCTSSSRCRRSLRQREKELPRHGLFLPCRNGCWFLSIPWFLLGLSSGEITVTSAPQHLLHLPSSLDIPQKQDAMVERARRRTSCLPPPLCNGSLWILGMNLLGISGQDLGRLFSKGKWLPKRNC